MRNQASLYFLDGGTEIKDLIEQSNEPWRPLSKFIVLENAHNKSRTMSEFMDLNDTMEKYRLEYAQSTRPESIFP